MIDAQIIVCMNIVIQPSEEVSLICGCANSANKSKDQGQEEGGIDTNGYI